MEGGRQDCRKGKLMKDFLFSFFFWLTPALSFSIWDLVPQDSELPVQGFDPWSGKVSVAQLSSQRVRLSD